MQKILSLVLIVLLVTIIGCKNGESPNTPSIGAAPSIPQVSFKGPNTNDTTAATAKYNATLMNAVMSPGAVFSALPAQQNGNTYTWTISAVGVTQKFTGIKQADGSFTWTWVINGTISTRTYNNYKLWEGTTSADGKNGTWSIYAYDQTGKVDSMTYTTDANGTLTGTLIVFNTNQTIDAKSVVVNNVDGSGSVVIYTLGTIRSYRAEWKADQSGQEWIYLPDGVTVYSTNTWVKS
jgi:hypothetical protein